MQNVQINNYILLFLVKRSFINARHSFLGLPKLKERPMVETNKTSTLVIIRWSKPDTTESLNEMISYDVECFLCEEKICSSPCSTNVMFNPPNDDLHSTFVVVTKLQPGRTYVFRVYPKNSLNKRIPKDKWNFLETEYFTYQPSSKKFCFCLFLVVISHA
jgi:hypothetical protein